MILNIIPYNLKFLIKFFFLNLLFLAFVRFLFIINYYHLFVDIPTMEIIRAFFVGAKLDSSLLAYVFIPFFLLGVMPFIGVGKKSLSRKVFGYLISITFLLIACLSLIDIPFFGEFNSHLNLTFIEYLNDDLGIIAYMIWREYPVITYLFLFAIFCLFYLYFANKIIHSSPKSEKCNFSNSLRKIFFSLIFIGFLGLLARGSTGVSQLNWGGAYFSKYNIVNQSALNPVYNLYRNIYYASKAKNKHLFEKISYFESDKKAIAYAQNSIISGDFPNEKYPFYKNVKKYGKEKKFNLILIVLEEFSGELVGVLGNSKGLTPYFDKLSKKGILFTNFFSNGQRTNKGLSATICSWPTLIGKSMMKQTQGQQNISSIASILKGKGYSTSFLYGGDIQYDNMKGFFISKGYDNFVSVKDFERRHIFTKWGVPDEVVFDKVIEVCDESYENSKPFFATMMSLTNHPPYDVPHYKFGKVNFQDELNKNYNTFKYVDWCLEKFFEEIEKKPYFENTLFVIVGDHSKSFHHDLSFDYRKSYVPALFYAPKLLKHRVIDKICSQIDIGPTIFEILNMSYWSSFWGKNMLLPSSKSDYVSIVRNSKFGFIKNGYYLMGEYGNKNTQLYKLWDFKSKVNNNKIENDFLKEIYAIQQSAYSLYRQRRITPETFAKLK